MRFQLTGVENNLLVGGELGSNGSPEGLEIGGRADDVAMAVYRA